MESRDNEFINYVEEPKQLNDLTKKFLTGEYILFGKKLNLDIKNNDSICNIGRFVAVPYNWDDYSVDEKNRFLSDVREFRHG